MMESREIQEKNERQCESIEEILTRNNFKRSEDK